MDLGGTLRRRGGRVNEISSETLLMTWYVSTETINDGDWWKLVWGQRFVMAASLKCSPRRLRYLSLYLSLSYECLRMTNTKYSCWLPLGVGKGRLEEGGPKSPRDENESVKCLRVDKADIGERKSSQPEEVSSRETPREETEAHCQKSKSLWFDQWTMVDKKP